MDVLAILGFLLIAAVVVYCLHYQENYEKYRKKWYPNGTPRAYTKEEKDRADKILAYYKYKRERQEKERKDAEQREFAKRYEDEKRANA